MNKTLEQIIKQYVQLQPPNPKGWQAIQCKVCHDHTRKGLRGAFLFDGETVVYKCWNCSIKAKYNPNENEYMPKGMIKILEAFSIPIDQWQEVVLSSPAFLNGGKHSEHKTELHTNIEPKELTMPNFFYFLKNAAPDDEVAELAREYLIDDRGVNPDDYPFMLANKAKNPKLHKWLARIIVPIFKDNKLIYYIGRAMYDATKKYETPATPKEKVLYGFDRLFEHTDLPLLVVEGWFDAYMIDGVATLGNVITTYQTQWLNRSRREKIYIPDKFGNGRHAAEQALENGWFISTPDIGSGCKDMDDAVRRYGKMYVIKSIIENKSKGFEATISLASYCES